MAVELTVTLDDQGQVSVEGPLDNQLACFGMLETAKMIIRERAQKKASSRGNGPKIVPVNIRPPDDIGKA